MDAGVVGRDESSWLTLKIDDRREASRITTCSGREMIFRFFVGRSLVFWAPIPDASSHRYGIGF